MKGSDTMWLSLCGWGGHASSVSIGLDEDSVAWASVAGDGSLTVLLDLPCSSKQPERLLSSTPSSLP